MSASSGGYKQGRIPRNESYQPILILGIRVPNEVAKSKKSSGTDGNTYQHTRVVTNGFRFARVG